MCAKITPSAIAVMLAAIACSEPMSPPARPRVQAGLAPPARGYTITDLGTLGGGFAEARAINDVGQVVGLSETAAGEQHAFVWTAAGGMKDLGTLGGTFSRAFAINHLGHVAGVSELPSGERRPFLWTPAGGMQDLGTFGGGFGRARGINDLDQVVGRSDLPDGSFHAFLWTAAQGMTDLAPVVGNNSEALDVNNRLQVAGGGPFGTDANPCAFTIAFLWSSRGGFHNLGSLGFTDPCGGGAASAVNEGDVVVGLSENDAFAIHAFRWTATAGMVDIGSLLGASGTSVATAVNALGQIVGLSTTGDGTIEHAFVWDERSGMRDLGIFPGDLQSEARGINGDGQVVGISISDHTRAVLWTPSH